MWPIVRNNILVLVAVIARPALAQELPRFLDSARQRNVDARLAAQSQVRAEADLGQAWGALLPVLSASAGYTYNQLPVEPVFPTGGTPATEKVVITPRDQLEATLKVELPLIDVARWLKTSAGATSARAAAARVAATWDAVRRQVVAGYYAYVAARAVLGSAQRSLELARAQAEQTRARTEAGVANELELVRAEAEVRRNEQLVADADDLLALSGRALRTLTGLEPGLTPSLPDDDLHPEAPLPQLEGRLEGLAAVQAADHDAAAAAQTLTAAGLALAPTVNAQLTQRFTNATGFGGKDSYYNAGLSLSWRLDVPSVHGLLGQRAQVATADLNAERARDEARDQIHSDWQKVRASLIKVRAAGAQVTSARRASELMHQRYRAGVATQTDVIQAERDLFSAEVADIQARGELAQARASLRLSTNTPLFEAQAP
jgi:outer membrane protein TolC